MKVALILLILASGIFASVAAAQDRPPIPRPRPDREAIIARNAEIARGEAQGVDAVAAPSGVDARTVIDQVFSGLPQPVTLSAKLIDDGPLIPAGLVWRVFSSVPGADGQLELVAKSEDASAAFSLSPGPYVAHVAYGFVQSSDAFEVSQAPEARTVVLEAGALRLGAAIAGDVPIEPQSLAFDIFPGGAERDDRTPIARDIKPGETVHLNAGVYHVVSRFGSLNATVRADLRVDPGQLTDATLFHHAAQVSFKLVSEPGGEAIADVEWTIKDSDGAIVMTTLSVFPTAILAEGDYTVLAKRGESVFNREFSVAPGPAKEIELLTQLRGGVSTSPI